ncbi:ATP synthase mitochondrial F1 complex assembly factor 2-like [Macrosteles quadrilineatus]|uniref:ATP synthase mitochondrial F1 complex assembly factor 2-like n=1 Tax=Macrosteles quadrilineatus TaxID=74068 RepID=UPI0023E1CBF4|nr:ATP synthase mitochondrial F1 complex assembly factor 2-like [Macrosteles quadrilineatus]
MSMFRKISSLGLIHQVGANCSHSFCQSQFVKLVNVPYLSRKIHLTVERNHPALPKRFYRKTSILRGDGQFEITLDQRKLKTPKGAILKVDNEALALAIATEWDSQKEEIQRSNMHLTALCSTVIDNPNNLTKFDIVQGILSYLETDTILFHSKEDENLYSIQQNEWQPHIDWFCQRFGVTIAATHNIGPPQVSDDIKAQIQRHLMSYNFAAIHGFLFAIEALKSAILTHACVERRISVEKAVLLTRLEEEFQCGHWGRVEWAHDLSQLDLQSRVAAAVLFIHLNSMSEHITAKRKATQ